MNAFTIPKQSVFGKSASRDRKAIGGRRGGMTTAASMDVTTATYMHTKCQPTRSPAKSTSPSPSSTR